MEHLSRSCGETCMGSESYRRGELCFMLKTNNQKEWTAREFVSLLIFIILMFLSLDYFWYQSFMEEVIARGDRGVLMGRDVIGLAVINLIHTYKYQTIVLLLILVTYWLYLKKNKKGSD